MSARAKARVRLLHGGVDEAGLGPKLGPLCIASFATAGPRDLRMAMAAAFGDPGAKAPMLEVGDSKEIYLGARKLARLERSALATWMWTTGAAAPPRSAAELIAKVASPSAPAEPAPWFAPGAGLDDPLPRASDEQELLDTVEHLRQVASAAGVEPLVYRADVISAASFNRELGAEVDEGGTKNTWVVARTLGLVRELMAHPAAAQGAAVLCDKAGGRDDYMRPLARAFPERMADELDRTRGRSDYALHGLMERSAETRLSFAMKADRFEPRVGLASCLAKYLRELTMASFNRWFVEQRPELRPTAGYPQDARRFIDEADDLAAAVLERSQWIRER